MHFVVGKAGISYNGENRNLQGAEVWGKTG